MAERIEDFLFKIQTTQEASQEFGDQLTGRVQYLLDNLGLQSRSVSFNTISEFGKTTSLTANLSEIATNPIIGISDRQTKLLAGDVGGFNDSITKKYLDFLNSEGISIPSNARSINFINMTRYSGLDNSQLVGSKLKTILHEIGHGASRESGSYEAIHDAKKIFDDTLDRAYANNMDTKSMLDFIDSRKLLLTESALEESRAEQFALRLMR